jgi:hypothetical protein
MKTIPSPNVKKTFPIFLTTFNEIRPIYGRTFTKDYYCELMRFQEVNA